MTSCRVILVLAECGGSVVVAHCSERRSSPLGEHVAEREARAGRIEHEPLNMNCKSVAAPDARGC
jgi:hypothetical protein